MSGRRDPISREHKVLAALVVVPGAGSALIMFMVSGWLLLAAGVWLLCGFAAYFVLTEGKAIPRPRRRPKWTQRYDR